MGVSIANETVIINYNGSYTPEFARRVGSDIVNYANVAAERVEERLRAEASAALVMAPGTFWYNAAKPGDFYYVDRDPVGTSERILSLARGTHSNRRYWENRGVIFRRVEVNPRSADTPKTFITIH